MEKFSQLFLQRGRQYLITVRSSLWLIPGLMIGFSIILALFLIEVDTRLDVKWYKKYPRIFGLGSDGYRGMLTAIASSMLTVAGLCFSLTLSTISQASAQYTPRILRNFMRDRTNQFILGYFVSIFAYCLMVLRTIRGADEMKVCTVPWRAYRACISDWRRPRPYLFYPPHRHVVTGEQYY